MGKFLEKEKSGQIHFKLHSKNSFSIQAKENGIYPVRYREFCLPHPHSGENLYKGIRKNALAYFNKMKIAWHDAISDKPSNHLCDSQVCCVNFLFPFSRNQETLSTLMRPVFGCIKKILPMEADLPKNFLAFEWIGEKNYLGEKSRTRGANCTSTDAAFMFEREDGRKQIVLIEWKYSESYGDINKARGNKGVTRLKTYRGFFEEEKGLLKKELVSYEELFYEPFYQLMRQQMLANEMEKAREFGADAVTVLHIAPEVNTDFNRITSPKLRDRFEDMTAIELWKKLLSQPDRFESISTEKLFRSFPIEKFPDLRDWWQYICTRYSWVK